MMGRLFVILIFFCLFLLFVSFCGGTLFSFLLLRKKARLGVKLAYSLLLGSVIFVFLFIASGYLMYREENLSLDYWRHKGTYDWLKLSYESYRVPLEYPYELYMGKGWDNADIRGWWNAFSDEEEEKRRIIIFNVLSLYKHNSLVIGEYSTATYGTEPEAWFIFDCNDGSKILYENKAEFLDAIKDVGASAELRLTPVKQAWKEFWADSSNWKGKDRMPVRSGARIKSDWTTDPPPAEKIAATNEVRKKLGIRQIKEHWTFYGREFGAEILKDGKSPCKVVQHDKSYETILSEQDSYYTGRQFRSLDGETSSVAEYLAVFYDYRKKRFGLAVVTDNEEIMDMEQALYETTLVAVGEIHGFIGRTNDETLKVADKILKMWGLERL